MTTECSFPPAAELLVHRPPVLFLESLLDWSPTSARGRFVVGHNPLYLREGALDPLVTIEILSQLAAAAVNYGYRRDGAKEPRTGYLMAIDDFTLHEDFRILPGEELLLTWELAYKFGPVSIHKLQSFFGGALHTSARIKGGEDAGLRTIL